MKIIEQSVEVIYPGTVGQGIQELKHIEMAGRNCWRSEGRITEDSYKAFVKGLLSRGHGSPVEFGHIILKITTSRDVMAELTRHRLASYCVESQRYVDEYSEGDIHFIAPLFYKEDPDDPLHAYDDKQFYASMVWRDTMENVEQSYKHLCELGMKNEDARKVLPNSTATTIFIDVNLRELLHIYELRSAKFAYPEMRKCMELLKEEVDKVLPGFLPDDE